jgi:hypothetical protein
MLDVAPRLRLHLVGGLGGGAGRSITAALLALGLHLLGRKTVLVQQVLPEMSDEFDLFARLPIARCRLALPPALALPADTNPGVQSLLETLDDRFLATLRGEVLAQVGREADIVVDLCAADRALNAALMREAFVVLTPARFSIFELDAALRTLTRARDVERYRGFVTPSFFVPIGPDNARADLFKLFGLLLHDYDPDDALAIRNNCRSRRRSLMRTPSPRCSTSIRFGTRRAFAGHSRVFAQTVLSRAAAFRIAPAEDEA